MCSSSFDNERIYGPSLPRDDIALAKYGMDNDKWKKTQKIANPSPKALSLLLYIPLSRSTPREFNVALIGTLRKSPRTIPR